tara:strand:+ start:66 stop:584 length:519 start_codon:yes stop_codon:yes gene_type:complete
MSNDTSNQDNAQTNIDKLDGLDSLMANLDEDKLKEAFMLMQSLGGMQDNINKSKKSNKSRKVKIEDLSEDDDDNSGNEDVNKICKPCKPKKLKDESDDDEDDDEDDDGEDSDDEYEPEFVEDESLDKIVDTLHGCFIDDEENNVSQNVKLMVDELSKLNKNLVSLIKILKNK